MFLHLSLLLLFRFLFILRLPFLSEVSTKDVLVQSSAVLTPTLLGLKLDSSECLCFCFPAFVLQGAGVMSVYLFMKRYTEEDLYHPHPTFYRPRVSNCSDYSRQFLHPDFWPPQQRGRSSSDFSSDISIQLNQSPPSKAWPKYSSGKGGARPGGLSQPTPPTSSAPSSSASSHLQLQTASSSSTFSSCPHPLHPDATSTLPRAYPNPSGPPALTLPWAAPPSAVPPPHYRSHMRMRASPC